MKKAPPENAPLTPYSTEIAQFEEFLKIVGFKRTEGSIYGLLVLSADSLSSEDIGKSLGLSQGAVSQGLKNLTHWGAVTSRYSPQHRAHLHSATQDSLQIVSSVFQKREKGAIEAFRRVNETARDRFLAEGDTPESSRIKRLNSNITTCEFAQVIMDFAISLSRLGFLDGQYAKIIRTLPRVLDVLVKGPKTITNLRNQVLEKIKERSPWA